MFLRPLLCTVMVNALFLPATAQVPVKPSRQFSFEQFYVPLYRGPLKIPEDVHKDAEGVWRDSSEKGVADLEVNFAGEYYLSAHSCGTSCRYYTLNDLRSGREFSDVSMFDAGEPL